MRTSVTRTVTTVAVLLLLTVGACSGDDSEGEGSLDLEATTAAAPSASPDASGPPSESASPDRPEDGATEGVAVRAGEIDVSGERRAVADALLTYLDVRLTAYHTVQVDLPVLAAASTGAATQQVRQGVAYLEQEKLHTVGELVVNVDRVTLDGRKAKVSSCARNTTADANRKGEIVELDAPSHYDIAADAVKVGADTWLVSDIEFSGTGGCTNPA